MSGSSSTTRMLTLVLSPQGAVALLLARQADRELGVGVLFTCHLDRAAMLLRDDVVADRQAQTSAFACRLGREERLKELVPDLARDASAVVAHSHFDCLTEIARCHSESRPK